MDFEATVLCDDLCQVIHSFGASDAWTPALLVTCWSDADRERVAQLLFDSTLDGDGRPRGVGLTCWRFLIGAGSARSRCIADPFRRTECFLRSDYTRDHVTGEELDPRAAIAYDRSYDFTRSVGQRWFLHAAKRKGVPHLLAFVHSPPAPLTANGLTHQTPAPGGEGHPTSNLVGHRGLCSAEFVTYIAKILNHFRGRGIHFTAVTPVNEPHFAWNDDRQEGCTYQNREVKRVSRELKAKLNQFGLQVDVGIPDAGSIDYLINPVPGKAKFSNFLWELTEDSKDDRASDGLQRQIRAVTGHSFYSCWTHQDRLVGSRQELRRALQPLFDKGIQYWMTEYTIQMPLGEKWFHPAAARELFGCHVNQEFDYAGMDAALWVARVIHLDLTVANASAWHYGLAMSPPGLKEGLIYVDPASRGGYTATKTLWALAHWSFFVRPGMRRVNIAVNNGRTVRETVDSLMLSAFIDKRQDRVIVVGVNFAHAETNMQVGLQSPKDKAVVRPACVFTAYLTTQGPSNMAPFAVLRMGERVVIPKRAIVTLSGSLVYEGETYRLTVHVERALCLDGSARECGSIAGCKPPSNRNSEQADQDAQCWQFRPSPHTDKEGRGCFRLRCLVSGLFLEALSSTGAKAAVRMEEEADNVAQLWRLEPALCGRVYILAFASGHVLEGYGLSLRTNARTGRIGQLWRIARPVDDPPRAGLPAAPSARTADALAAPRPGDAPEGWAGDWDPASPAGPPPGETPRQVLPPERPRARHDPRLDAAGGAGAPRGGETTRLVQPVGIYRGMRPSRRLHARTNFGGRPPTEDSDSTRTSGVRELRPVHVPQPGASPEALVSTSPGAEEDRGRRRDLDHDVEMRLHIRPQEFGEQHEGAVQRAVARKMGQDDAAIAVHARPDPRYPDQTTVRVGTRRPPGWTAHVDAAGMEPLRETLMLDGDSTYDDTSDQSPARREKGRGPRGGPGR